MLSPWRLVVLVCTRPLRLSDAAAAWRWLLARRARPPALGSAVRHELEPARLERPRVVVDADAWVPGSPANRGFEMSEEPLDTLPAELQNEFSSLAPAQPAREATTSLNARASRHFFCQALRSSLNLRVKEDHARACEAYKPRPVKHLRAR
jgi:hypothetical protein